MTVPAPAALRPTGSGVAVLAGSAVLLTAGLGLGYPALSAAGTAGAAALVAALCFTLPRPRLTVTRQISPDRVTAGQATLGRLTIDNVGRLPTPRLTAVEHLDNAALPVAVAPVAGRGRRSLHYPIHAPYRGRIRLGPVVLDRRDPLGLLHRSARLAGEATLWVHPCVHPVRALPVGAVPDFEGRLSERAPHGSTAFSSLREYMYGDDPRQIHWRSTARLGRLVVREHVDTTEPTVAIVLDTRVHADDADTYDAAAFEAAVQFAASVAVASGRVGQAVTLDAVGEDRAEVGRAGGHGILDRLAALRRTGSDRSALLELVERRPAGGCLVVICGGGSDLVARLAAQRRRFSRVVVTLIGADAPGSLTRRSGLTVIRSRNVTGAVAAWNQFAGRHP